MLTYPLKKLGEVIEKSSQLTTQSIKPSVQSSQSKEPKLIAASDVLVKSFSKINDCKNF